MAGNRLNFGGLRDMISWGWTTNQIVESITDFRRRTIKKLTHASFIEPEFLGELLHENDLTWKIIFGQPGEVLGFWQLVPLTVDGYKLSIAGEICGERIVRDLVPRMQPGNWYDTYFFSLSICPSIRKSMAMIGFAGTIIQSLVELAKREIYINNMSMCLASNYTLDMNRFFLRFEYCSQHVVSGEMYKTHLPSFLNSSLARISAGRNMRELMQLYSDRRPPIAAPA